MVYLILLVALAFRLVLVNQSFWLDEASSLLFAKLSLPQLFSAISADFHPPFFYMLLHYWLKLGLVLSPPKGITSEWFLRLPNIIFGVVTVWLFYKLLQLLKTKTNSTLPFIGALLLAINPLHIYYSQELRMYSLNVLLTVASWHFLLKLLRNKSSILNYIFCLLTLANFYTFYGSFFNLFAQFVYVLIYHRKEFRQTLYLFLPPIIFFLPWLPTLQKQLAGGQYLQAKLPLWVQLSGTLDIKSILLIPLKFSLGRLNLSTNNLYLLVASITSLYFFSLIVVGLRSKLSRLFTVWLVVPLLLALIISIKTPVLGYWRYIYLLPAFSALIALGINLLPDKLKYLNLFVVIVTLLMANILFWLNPTSWREDWKSALVYAQDFNQQKTISLFAFPDAFAPVRWYAPNLHYSAPLYNLTSDPAQLDLKLSQDTNGISTILYFNYLSPLTDPAQNIRTWLINAGFKESSIKDFRGVGFVYVYTAPRAK